MLGGVLEVDPFRACGHDGATRVARRSDKRCFVHQPQCVPTKQRAVMIRLVREDHFDHGDDLGRAMNHEPKTFRPLRFGQGKRQHSESAAFTLPSPRRRVHTCSLSSKLLGRSSDLQATYLLQLPSSWLNQCLCRSVRSCLPLRGSSGFSPDSLLSPIS